MHGGLVHLLVNMLLIFFFGKAIEDALGRNALLRIYLLSGIVGGLVQLLYQVAMHKLSCLVTMAAAWSAPPLRV